MLDSFGRDIDYIRISLTDRCNLRCIYCMPENLKMGEKYDKDDQISELEKKDAGLTYDQIIKILKAAVGVGIKKVRYTGGEPLIFDSIEKLIYDTSKMQQIKDISITTNGIFLNDKADDLKKAGLKRVNISLDTLREDRYRAITRGGKLHDVMNAVNKCLSIGIQPVKINTVVIRGINDDEISDFIRLTKEFPVHVRFIELMPIGEGIKFYKNGFMSSAEIISKHPELVFLRRPKGETASIYKLNNSKGTVEFISPVDCKFCSSCNRIRLTSAGSIKPCLHSESEFKIKKYVYSEELLKSALKNAIINKPFEHKLDVDNRSKCTKAMFQIGG